MMGEPRSRAGLARRLLRSCLIRIERLRESGARPESVQEIANALRAQGLDTALPLLEARDFEGLRAVLGGARGPRVSNLDEGKPIDLNADEDARHQLMREISAWLLKEAIIGEPGEADKAIAGSYFFALLPGAGPVGNG